MKKQLHSTVELNPQFSEALEFISKGKNVFITGRAGTGKSTLLKYYSEHSQKKIVILAPTGVAAINVGGQTIHHFFGFGPDITIRKIPKKLHGEREKFFQKLTTIVIDEISMVRADLLDFIDTFLRAHGPRKNVPFGGVQMVFIGDLYQLPPVVTSQEKEVFRSRYESPYFFSAKSFPLLNMEFIELEKIYRQKDEKFIELLNAIRNKTATEREYRNINKRYDPDFMPPNDIFYISLTSTNAGADIINEQEMEKLPGKNIHLQGIVYGDFPKEYYPTAISMNIKIGAQVMMLNNDASGRWVNGTIGKVLNILFEGKEIEGIEIDLQNGKTHLVTPYTWDVYRFYVNENKEIDSEEIGSFTQFPIRIAFAVTIHKAQGKTFEKVVIDIGRGTFAHGQMYVALSRCTSLEGMVLKKEIRPQHVWLDYAIVRFLTKYQYKKSKDQISTEEKIKIITDAIHRKKNLKITYLKAKDVKSRRIIRPESVGEMKYNDIPFLGVSAYCLTRKDSRNFNVEKI
ncbi:AAA family ATPase, partial [Candidatus Peregrinibacteria bacterium]|nr:AAA family ATPase [Candidatus Peregrinibacteria bacterium]